MNLIGHRIHHVSGGYGYLIFPWFGVWLIWFDGGGDRYPALRRGFRLMNHQFHNCTATGVY